MFNDHDIETLRNATAVGTDGEKLGSVGDVYVDDQTGQPTWVTINTGLFGTSTSFVPLEGARREGDQLVLAHTKEQVKDAPRIAEDGHLSPEEEAELYRYYSKSYDTTAAGFTGDRTVARDGVVADDVVADRDRVADRDVVADRNVADDAAEVAVHEEQLVVGKERREAGQVRLRKVTHTETRTVQVPVTREEVVVERIPGSGQVVDGAAFNDGDVEQVVTLHEEVPVVDKQVVETERVRLDKQAVTEQHSETAQIRKEEVVVDGDGVRQDVDGRTDRI